MMYVYLASRYERREELCGYRASLEALGHVVTSRWLNGTHQLTNEGKRLGDAGVALIEAPSDATRDALRAEFAQQDLADIRRADIVMSFTDPKEAGKLYARGGRHVEFGYALALPRRQMLVGPRENLFHWCPCVEVYATFEDAVEAL